MHDTINLRKTSGYSGNWHVANSSLERLMWLASVRTAIMHGMSVRSACMYCLGIDGMELPGKGMQNTLLFRSRKTKFYTPLKKNIFSYIIQMKR